ncbi:hypothetical protein N431DRAFT_451397 [Stipitochalara longipes BDJ]|nr:hypothetical protein N431DRAFT_451397 [Stipitochalara longipes BDJ]
MVTSGFTTQAETPKALSIFILIFYIVLLQPVTFIFYCHGLRSWLAWLPFQSLCFLRIVGSGIQLDTHKTKTITIVALVLNNIGLAPLLLAAIGILHEARAARNPNLRRKLECYLVIHFHIIIVVAMVLVIIGLVKITGNHPQESDTKLPKVGVVIILVYWATLVGGTIFSFRSSQCDRQAPAYRSGTKLLHGVTVALPFVGIREFGAVLSNFVTSRAFLTSLPAKVCLSVIPEMIVIIILVTAGLAAHDIRGEMKRQRKVDERGVIF